MRFIRTVFATGHWQRPRRPSTPAGPEAGLLTADPLRPPAAWMGVRPQVLCKRDLIRPPATRRLSMKSRVVLFLLFAAALVVVPAVVAGL